MKSGCSGGGRVSFFLGRKRMKLCRLIAEGVDPLEAGRLCGYKDPSGAVVKLFKNEAAIDHINREREKIRLVAGGALNGDVLMSDYERSLRGMLAEKGGSGSGSDVCGGAGGVLLKDEVVRVGGLDREGVLLMLGKLIKKSGLKDADMLKAVDLLAKLQGWEAPKRKSEELPVLNFSMHFGVTDVNSVPAADVRDELRSSAAGVCDGR